MNQNSGQPRRPQQPKGQQKRKMRTGFKVAIAVVAVLLVWIILAVAVPNPFAKPFLWLYGCYRAGDANREDPSLTADLGTFEDITFTDETEDGPMRPTGEPATAQTGETAEPVKPDWKIDATEVSFDAAGLPLICNTEDVFNVLVIGLDTRDASSITGNLETDDVSATRADTIMLVSVNTKTHQITLTSFLRDTYVQIPGVTPQKLGHAFAFGQAPLLIQTLKQNFNVQVDYYVYLNFYIFIDIVEAMGGVDVELSAEEIYTMNRAYLSEVNKLYNRPEGTDYLPETPGYVTESGYHNPQTYHLNGYQALGYVRNRYDKCADGDLYDWSRVYRQKHMLELMKEKAKGLSIGQLDGLAQLVMSKLTTNMDRTLIATLIMNAMDYMKYELVTQNAPELTVADGTKNVYNEEGDRNLGVTFDYKKVFYRVYETIYGKKPDSN